MFLSQKFKEQTSIYFFVFLRFNFKKQEKAQLMDIITEKKDVAATIPAILQELKKGKMVIVCDDEGRENEGDLIAAAEMVTPEMINFMATNAKGLICAALTPERCCELKLEPMVTNNTSSNTTNFTVSIDLLGQGCTTGISAYDRAKTLNALANPNTKPEELGRPGHIFPIIANPEGVLKRPGHTEASVDLPRLAGLSPVGVLVEVMKADGTMARYPDLVEFAKKFDLKITTVKKLIEYRKENEKNQK
jgi:3,4-dihydroxy 2-butanone 4-phosphate synthase/GTP cyclohydrolase II